MRTPHAGPARDGTVDGMRTEQALPRDTRPAQDASGSAVLQPRRGWAWAILAIAAAVGIANAIAFVLTA